MVKKFKAGIIGAGNIGFRYTLDPLRNWVSSHLQAYRKHQDFEPVAICDIDGTKLREAKSYMPSLRVYASWREMLKNERIDILSVCVSPEINFEVCVSPYFKNIKALILEKPFARNVSAGRRVIRILKEKKVVAAVNYFRRWQKTFWTAKDIIHSGKIGMILKVNAFYPCGIWNGGSHMVDALHFLLGNFDKIQALSRSDVPGSDDPLYSVFGHIGDIEVFLCGFKRKNFNIFDIEIWGRKGKIIISDYGKRIILQQALSSSRFSGQKELAVTKEIVIDKYNRYFLDLLDNISGVLKNRETNVLCTPGEALKTTRVIQAIEDSNKYEKEISLTWR